jgi:cytochrome c556
MGSLRIVPAGLAGCQRCGIYLGEAASKPFRWIVATNGGTAPTDDSESADGSNLSAGTAADRSSAATVSPADGIGDVSPRATLLAPPPTPAPANSQSAAATAVSVRKGTFKVMGSEVQLLIAALDAAPSDASTVGAKALHVEQLAAMIPDLFALDTHAFAVDTTALPKIWTEQSKFDAKANELMAAMYDLFHVANTPDTAGDRNLTLRKTAARALAICGECHAVYRQPGAPGDVGLK